ncbi:molybdopterin-binding protein [Embleya sp. NPDC059213]|uniref:molybdopterin-binding protein n=2 Tax=unclassified Embleya TaxID=2699296 RepID=UPI0036A0BBC4
MDGHGYAVAGRGLWRIRGAVGAGAVWTGSLAAAVRESHDADVVVGTGSTSVGSTDRRRRLLRTGGAEAIVDTVACRPGHPQLPARLGADRRLVGLPGNPYAALVAAYTLRAPLLAGLTGRPSPRLPPIPVTGEVRPAPGITRLVPSSGTATAPAWWADTARHSCAAQRPPTLSPPSVPSGRTAAPPHWSRSPNHRPHVHRRPRHRTTVPTSSLPTTSRPSQPAARRSPAAVDRAFVARSTAGVDCRVLRESTATC